MDISTYPYLKHLIITLLNLTKDAIHIYVGFFCLLASVILMRRPLTSYWALALGLVVSGMMEVLDLRYNYGLRGDANWVASLHDLINTNLIPFLLVFLARRKWLKVC
jgi:hypothetical protein